MLTFIFTLLYLGGIEAGNNTYYMIFPENKTTTPYVKRVINKVCLLKPMNGPCRAQIGMYHFKPEEMDCVEFIWGGCQGNGNRFDTKEECLETCLQKNNTFVDRPKYCTLTFDYGMCFGHQSRWYYDRVWKLCKERIYSGCGGNKNNFYTKKECEVTCHYGVRYRKHLEARGEGLTVSPSPDQLRSGGSDNYSVAEKNIERNIIDHVDKT